MKNNRARLSFIFFLIAALPLIIINSIGCSEPRGTKAVAGEQTTAAAAPGIAYVVANKDATGGEITYRLTINERADEAALVEVLRKLRKENNDWQDKLVCFFYMGVYSDGGAWATCAYLPQCNECANTKDADGNPVEYRLIGVSRGLADSLQKLSFDSIPAKKLLASYIEDNAKCKSQLFVVGDDNSKLLHVQLFNEGEHLVEWLTRKMVNNEKRYDFKDEDPGEENYIVLEEADKTIRFKNHEDKEWMAYLYTTN